MDAGVSKHPEGIGYIHVWRLNCSFPRSFCHYMRGVSFREVGGGGGDDRFDVLQGHFTWDMT